MGRKIRVGRGRDAPDRHEITTPRTSSHRLPKKTRNITPTDNNQECQSELKDKWHRRNPTGRALQGTLTGQLEVGRNPVGPRPSPIGRCPHLSRPVSAARFLLIPHPGSKQPGPPPLPSLARGAWVPITTGPALTVRGAVGDARPRVSRVGVVGVALRIEVIEEDVHLVWRQQLRGFHVVVRQARVVRVGVLRIQHGRVRHPARLLRRHLHGRRRRLGVWVEAATALREEGGVRRAASV